MQPDIRSIVPPAALRLKIDAGALAHNWLTLNRWSGAANAGAAVKADAYGLGAGLVVPVLANAGCRDWFVAHWGEVPDVLDHVPAATISVLHGPMTAADAAFARASGVRPVINSLAQAQLWLAGGGGPCDVMVDTGMNRLGLSACDLGAAPDCREGDWLSVKYDLSQAAATSQLSQYELLTLMGRRFSRQT